MTTATNLDEQLAQWAAEDAKVLAEYKAEQAYNLLVADLTAVEDRIKAERRAAGNYDTFFVTDTNCDYENAITAGYAYGSIEFWETCLSSAGSAAGARAEAEGLNINALLGRSIY
jgi:hypothetical protein